MLKLDEKKPSASVLWPESRAATRFAATLRRFPAPAFRWCRKGWKPPSLLSKGRTC